MAEDYNIDDDLIAEYLELPVRLELSTGANIIGVLDDYGETTVRLIDVRYAGYAYPSATVRRDLLLAVLQIKEELA